MDTEDHTYPGLDDTLSRDRFGTYLGWAGGEDLRGMGWRGGESGRGSADDPIVAIGGLLTQMPLVAKADNSGTRPPVFAMGKDDGIPWNGIAAVPL